MTILLVVLHVAVCLFLIFVVLVQSAQAADLAGAFGGGGSQTALGMRGAATLLQKATTGAAVVFMLTSLALGISGRVSSSIIEGVEGTGVPAEEPVVPVTPAPEEDQGDVRGAVDPGERPGGEQSDGGEDGPGAP